MPNPSLRHCTQPSLAFPERVAFGAALRGGCAAAHRHKQPTDPCFPFNRDDDIRNSPMTLPTILSVSPIPSLVLGASLRDRATLPSPLRGLDPSGGYPSRLRSLRSLRGPLAGARRPPSPPGLSRCASSAREVACASHHRQRPASHTCSARQQLRCPLTRPFG